MLWEEMWKSTIMDPTQLEIQQVAPLEPWFNEDTVVPQPLNQMYLTYLGVESIYELALDGYEVFKDDPAYAEDEMWGEDPECFSSVLELGNVQSPGFSVGHVNFGMVGNIPVIIEQNASPLLVYVSRKNIARLRKFRANRGA